MQIMMQLYGASLLERAFPHRIHAIGTTNKQHSQTWNEPGVSQTQRKQLSDMLVFACGGSHPETSLRKTRHHTEQHPSTNLNQQQSAAQTESGNMGTKCARYVHFPTQAAVLQFHFAGNCGGESSRQLRA